MSHPFVLFTHVLASALFIQITEAAKLVSTVRLSRLVYTLFALAIPFLFPFLCTCCLSSPHNFSLFLAQILFYGNLADSFQRFVYSIFRIWVKRLNLEFFVMRSVMFFPFFNNGSCAFSRKSRRWSHHCIRAGACEVFIVTSQGVLWAEHGLSFFEGDVLFRRIFVF